MDQYTSTCAANWCVSTIHGADGIAEVDAIAKAQGHFWKAGHWLQRDLSPSRDIIPIVDAVEVKPCNMPIRSQRGTLTDEILERTLGFAPESLIGLEANVAMVSERIEWFGLSDVMCKGLYLEVDEQLISDAMARLGVYHNQQ